MRPPLFEMTPKIRFQEIVGHTSGGRQLSSNGRGSGLGPALRHYVVMCLKEMPSSSAFGSVMVGLIVEMTATEAEKTLTVGSAGLIRQIAMELHPADEG